MRLRERSVGLARMIEGHLQDLGEVERVTAGALGNLLAATESVGDNEPVGGRTAAGGGELEVADGGRDVVFFVLETEGAGHAAASGSWSREVDADAAQERLFGGHL